MILFLRKLIALINYSGRIFELRKEKEKVYQIPFLAHLNY